MNITTVTKIVESPNYLPPVVMMFFSDNASAERYAQEHGQVIWYCTSNHTFYVERAQPAETVK